jgi:hypothetical protein
VGDDVVQLTRDPRALLGDGLLGAHLALGDEHALALGAVAYEAPDDPGAAEEDHEEGHVAEGRRVARLDRRRRDDRDDERHPGDSA